MKIIAYSIKILKDNKIFVLVIFLMFQFRCYSQDNTNVVQNWLYYSNIENSLYDFMANEAIRQLDNRKQEIEKLKTLDDWEKRKQKIKIAFDKSVGPFPEKTKLNAQVTKIVKKDGYSIENVIFESQPGFYVTSSLYIPDNLTEKAPAVIYCSGHGATGYRSPIYQHAIINLVKKRFIVYAFDPVGQGERLHYLDSDSLFAKVIGRPTKQHSYPGAQAFILGTSQARYMIWDGIRAVDYLLTRKEVNPERIGITGRSGGGTQSAYIAAFDERIYAAAPECYITNFKRLFQSRGPQDAEQNFFHGIANGLDHADLLVVRSPKPALMITTFNDMFNIQGAIETADEVSKAYNVYNRKDAFAITTDFGVHESTRKNRETMYAFFQKWLNNPGNSEDVKYELPESEDLKVSESGQVSESLHSKFVYDLNCLEAERCYQNIQKSQQNPNQHLQGVLKKAQQLSSFAEPSNFGESIFTGKIKEGSYTIEKYFITNQNSYIIPYLLYKPENINGKAIIYLNPAGKSADDEVKSDLEWFMDEGFMVLVPDMLGTGETRPGDFRGDSSFGNVSYNLWYASILINKSITAMRAEDVVRLTQTLEKNPDIKEILAIARGNMSSVLLHAAAFCSSINKVALINSLSSYHSLVTSKYYSPSYVQNAVPGMLQYYDLPDLGACLAPRKLLMSEMTDENCNLLNVNKANSEFSFIKTVYEQKDATDMYLLQQEVKNMSPELRYRKWIE